MTTAPDLHDHDDRQARQLHAAALAHTSAPTLARLRQARHAASAGTRRRALFAPWLAGGAVAATVALAVVLQPGTQPGPSTGPAAATQLAAAPAAATTADPAQSLQEDPGFYVWLDSVDATALAME